MTDAEMYQILNDFAKDHALAVGLEFVKLSQKATSFCDKSTSTTIAKKVVKGDCMNPKAKSMQRGKK